MLMVKQQGANGLQPCTILYLSTPPQWPPNLKSDLYLFDKSRSPRNWQQQDIAATPTSQDENLQAPRYHDRSRDRQTQKHRVQSEHLVPQSNVPKHGTLVTRSRQNSCLQSSVNNASGPKVSRFYSNTGSVPADRKSVSEMSRTVRVSSPESPRERWI